MTYFSTFCKRFYDILFHGTDEELEIVTTEFDALHPNDKLGLMISVRRERDVQKKIYARRTLRLLRTERLISHYEESCGDLAWKRQPEDDGSLPCADIPF